MTIYEKMWDVNEVLPHAELCDSSTEIFKIGKCGDFKKVFDITCKNKSDEPQWWSHFFQKQIKRKR